MTPERQQEEDGNDDTQPQAAGSAARDGHWLRMLRRSSPGGHLTVGGCAAGSGADEIQFAPSVTGTIVLQSVRLTITAFTNADILLPITAPGSAVPAISGGNSPAAPTVNRMFWVSDGVAGTLFAATFSGLTLRDNRMVGGAGGCLGSREHLTLQDIVFDSCVSEGNATLRGIGGALSVGAGLADGVFTGARPDVTMNQATVRSSKALRGSNALP